MLKKFSYSFSILLPLLCLLFCSRFDESTGLGKDIIQDVDTSLTGVNKNFITVESSVTVDSAFSIPDQNDSLFGIHASKGSKGTKVLSVGTKDNVSASGFIEYKIDYSILNQFGITVSDTSNLIIDSLSLKLTVYSKQSIMPTMLNVFACLNADSTSRTAASRLFQIATLKLAKDSSSYSGISTDSILRTSARNIISTLKEKLKACNNDDKCKESIEPYYLRFYLYNADSCTLVHLSSSPTLGLHARKGTTSITKNIFPNYANYVAIGQNSDTLQKIPTSTFATLRTAVFKLDISNLWKTIDTNNFQILSAGFSVTPKAYKNIDKKDDSQREITVIYHLSDILFENNQKFLNQTLRAISKRISADSSTITPPDTFILSNLGSILKQLSNDRPSTVYLYLQLSSSSDIDYYWKEITWNNPKFKAILTSLK
ncbi:MAG TPA: hypothetical protein VHP36_04100 [Chitinispirillaceae bacterium]|nr:hypothetical protein [Chitinispirillaceae bacterium]